MPFVHLLTRNAGEQIEIHGVDLGRTFSSIRGGAIRRNVEGLVGIVRAIEVVRSAQIIRGVQVPVILTQNRAVMDLMLNRQAFVLVNAILKEAEQSDALAFSIASDQAIICAHNR